MSENVKQFTGNFASRLTPEAANKLNEIAAQAAAAGIKMESGADMMNHLLTLVNNGENGEVNTPTLSEGEVYIVVNEAKHNLQTEFYDKYKHIDIEALQEDLNNAVSANTTINEQLQEAIKEAGKYVNGEFLAADDKSLELVWAVYTKRKEAGKNESLQALIAAIFRLVMMPKINAQIDITEALSARSYLLNLPPAMQNLYK